MTALLLNSSACIKAEMPLSAVGSLDELQVEVVRGPIDEGFEFQQGSAQLLHTAAQVKKTSSMASRPPTRKPRRPETSRLHHRSEHVEDLALGSSTQEILAPRLFSRQGPFWDGDGELDDDALLLLLMMVWRWSDGDGEDHDEKMAA